VGHHEDDDEEGVDEDGGEKKRRRKAMFEKARRAFDRRKAAALVHMVGQFRKYFKDNCDCILQGMGMTEEFLVKYLLDPVRAAHLAYHGEFMPRGTWEAWLCETDPEEKKVSFDKQGDTFPPAVVNTINERLAGTGTTTGYDTKDKEKKRKATSTQATGPAVAKPMKPHSERKYASVFTSIAAKDPAVQSVLNKHNVKVKATAGSGFATIRVARTLRV
jgi:hypothetical protein